MIRDLNGDIIPLGKTIKKVEENFLTSTTLPNWLDFGGNGAPEQRIVGLESDYGYFEMKTGAATGDSAKLNIFPNGINMTNIKEVIIELDSLVFSSGSNIEFFLQFQSPSAHISLRSLPSNYNNTTLFDIRNDDTEVRDLFQIKQYPIIPLNEYKRRRNIALRLRHDGTLVLSSHDIVVAEYKMSSKQFNPNKIYHPELIVKTLDNTAKWLRISRIGVTIIHN